MFVHSVLKGLVDHLRKTSLIADITLLLVALIWGSTFVVVQNAIAFLEPITFNAVRFSIATLLLLSWLLLFQRKQIQACNRKLILARNTNWLLVVCRLCYANSWIIIHYFIQSWVYYWIKRCACAVIILYII